MPSHFAHISNYYLELYERAKPFLGEHAYYRNAHYNLRSQYFWASDDRDGHEP